jgi:dipeptidyl-peptidase-4
LPPSEIFGHGPFPTIVSVYGGPGVQHVTNSWGMTADMRAQYFRLKGYLVIKVDNRGSLRRGHAFEAALFKNMGAVELDDQAAAVAWASKQRLADPTRVGIYGWSYGGYMCVSCVRSCARPRPRRCHVRHKRRDARPIALMPPLRSAMALCKYPLVFKVAVAGAPVTSWDGYDTAYTERYMSLPQLNEKGYAESSVMNQVEKMEGKLMLVHGMIDENVHFRHTARLITALTHARKDYELLLFPSERHLPRSVPDRVYMEQRIEAFFSRHL